MSALCHRMKPMLAQIDEIEGLGKPGCEDLAEKLREIYRQVEGGYIKTVTELTMKQNKVIDEFKKNI